MRTLSQWPTNIERPPLYRYNLSHEILLSILVVFVINGYEATKENSHKWTEMFVTFRCQTEIAPSLRSSRHPSLMFPNIVCNRMGFPNSWAGAEPLVCRLDFRWTDGRDFFGSSL